MATLGDRLREALARTTTPAGETGRLAPQVLAPVDQFHTGGGEATRALLALVVGRPRRILDLGGGLGGAARLLAVTFGARVVVVDLSAELCQAGRLCSAWTGIEVDFACGDARAVPVASGVVDLLWMQQAAMNISEKEILFTEAARLLSPGGQFLFQEIVAGPRPGPLHLPVPWATVPAESHLVPPDRVREGLSAAGFAERSFTDVSLPLADFTRQRLGGLAGGVPALSTQLLMAADLRLATANTLRNLEEGRIAIVRGHYQRAAR
jgi:SAM-dependent methyltransferase